MIKKPEDYYRDKPIRNALMVCLGNICRSPMAEYLLRDKLQKAGVEGVHVSSAGFYDMAGRGAAPEIVKIMASKGISLAEHRSRILTRELIHENDLVVVVERGQREELARAIPGMADKVWLLSQFGKASGERDIPDPYGGSVSQYQACYEDVLSLVDGLADFLARNHSET